MGGLAPCGLIMAPRGPPPGLGPGPLALEPVGRGGIPAPIAPERGALLTTGFGALIPGDCKLDLSPVDKFSAQISCAEICAESS